MVKVAPNLYSKYITVDKKGTAILYFKMQKAVYDLLRSALLFYKKLVGELENLGFKLNPYDPCVANMTVNRTQMTVCWHVDDLKVSHIDAAEVTKFGQWLNTVVAKDCGKVLQYPVVCMRRPRRAVMHTTERPALRHSDAVPRHRPSDDQLARMDD
jgi:hypothetical protein